MATFRASGRVDLDQLNLLAAFNSHSTVSHYNSHGFTITGGGYKAIITGHGFQYGSSIPKGVIETLTLYKLNSPKTPIFTVTDLDMTVAQAYKYATDHGYMQTIFTGQDVIIGSKYSDTLDGYGSNDTLQGAIGNDKLKGGAGNDKLDGGLQNDRLDGGIGKDMLVGGSGRDFLEGGAGNDKLLGGADQDMFHFGSALGSANVDTVMDFKHGVDKISLDPVVFSVLNKAGLKTSFVEVTSKTAGMLHDDAQAVSAAQKNGPLLIYNRDNGFLYYDVDGKGGKAAVHFATIETDSAHHHTSLSYSDFIIG